MKALLGGALTGLGFIGVIIGGGLLAHAATPLWRAMPEWLLGAVLFCVGAGLLLIARRLYVELVGDE